MEEWIEPLKDLTVKEGKDKKAVFTCRFSKANCQAKWSWKRDVSGYHKEMIGIISHSDLFQEIFQGQKYKMSVEEDGFVHRLHISNPKTDDAGKYSCDINGISTSAFLEVEGESK